MENSVPQGLSSVVFGLFSWSKNYIITYEKAIIKFLKIILSQKLGIWE